MYTILHKECSPPYCQQLKCHPLHTTILAVLYELSSQYNSAMHMREQYILQPTKNSPETRNSSTQMQRMVACSGNTQAAGSMFDHYIYWLLFILISPFL